MTGTLASPPPAQATLARPPSAGELFTRLRWTALDGWVMTRRSLSHWILQPGAVAASLLFPVFMVLMFGYLFGGAISVPGGGSYREFLMPGMFAMTMLLGIGKTMLAINEDASKGITDRFRAMPTSSAAIFLGRCGADMIDAALTLGIMIGCGYAIGWQPNKGVGNALLAVALLLLLRFAFIWIGIYLGLIVSGAEAMNAVYTLEFPLGFLANAFVAPATMPGWLGTIANWNPLSSTVSATRELFGNPGWGGSSWIETHDLLMAVVWPLALTLVFFGLSVRSYRWLSR